MSSVTQQQLGLNQSLGSTTSATGVVKTFLKAPFGTDIMVFFDEQLVMFCFVNLFILRNTSERLLPAVLRWAD